MSERPATRATALLDPQEDRQRRGAPARGRALRRPAILDVRIGPLMSIYAWRLRRHAAQELLAAIGVAIGVALVFGVLVSSQSITGSAGRILHAITGKATLQVAARSPEGFDERLVASIGALPGVKVAAPLIRADAVMEGPGGHRPVQLVGSTVSQFNLEGSATRYLGSERLGGGIALGSSLSAQTGAGVGGQITLVARGRTTSLPVHAVWGPEQIGEVAHGSIAVVTLSVAQRALGLPHRVDQLLIVPAADMRARVRAEIARAAGPGVDVEPANHELAVLNATAQPSTQSSRLFAAVGAIVGFLFAVNAMLLTVPERRRWVAEARTHGYSAAQIVLVLGFQALVLGLVASAVGVLIGYALAGTIFDTLPSFLTLSFPIGDHPIVGATTVLAAIAAGVLATLVASVAPLRDLSRRRPIDAVFHGTGKIGHSIGTRTMALSAAAGVVLVAFAVALALALPAASIASDALLAIGAVCAVPPLLVAVMRAAMPLAERLRRSMLAIALAEAEGTATRSIALGAVAALAVYGTVAVLGARDDLVRGLDIATVQLFDTGEVWVTPIGNNPFLTDGFPGGPAMRATARAPGVASVRALQAAFLDIGSRRLWIRARPGADRSLVQPSQVLDGDPARATALIRGGEWAAVSSGFATERHLGVGSAFTLPAPAGRMPLRVAAITTNSGWPPGAITMNDRDYQRWWQSADPTALEIELKPGVTPTAGRRAVATALAAQPGLRVQSLAERERQNEHDARQGVQSLSEIATLILIAAALAMAFALTASIASRTADLASRKAEGYTSQQLWRVIALESGVVVAVGAAVGAALGICGHALADRWLRLSQGFPGPFALDPGQLLVALLTVIGVAAVVVVLAGCPAARVKPRPGSEE